MVQSYSGLGNSVLIVLTVDLDGGKLMPTREEIREGIRDILYDDLVNFGITHENPPPHKDCSEDCDVSIEDQIAAANPVCSPVRSNGKKHKRCVDCWNEYIDGLIKRIQDKEASQGVVIKVDIPEGWLLVRPNGNPSPYEGYTGFETQVADKQEIYVVEPLI